MRSISVKLPDDLVARIDRAAKVRRMTRSQLMHQCLENALRQESPVGFVSCFDLARDLVGTVKGLPEDLADNPKYRMGFGE